MNIKNHLNNAWQRAKAVYGRKKTGKFMLVADLAVPIFILSVIAGSVAGALLSFAAGVTAAIVVKRIEAE